MDEVVKTDTEIDAELDALREIKPRVRHYSAFVDDNRAAIDAIIDVLEEQADISDDYEECRNLYNAARDAWDWLCGEEVEGWEDGIAKSYESIATPRAS